MRPPFNLADVTLFTEADRLVRFPDRYKDTGVATPARYEGTSLWLMRIKPAAGHTTFPLLWPAESNVKVVQIAPGGPVSTLLEVSPMPFGIAALLREIPGGAPTFYLGYDSPPFPPQNAAVRVADAPVQLTSAWLGIAFQDRLTLAPWCWFDRIASAPLASQAWRDWSVRFAGRRSLRLLDAQGRPYANQTITVTRGTIVSTAISDAGGNLAGLPMEGTLSWQRSPALEEDALPSMALVDTPTNAVAGENAFTLPSGFVGGHLQLLALAEWFAPYLHNDPLSPEPGARFRRQSRMEPLVDGDAAFARLLEDLDHAKGDGGAAYFAGWAFNDFPLRPGDDSTTLINLASGIQANGGTARVLAAQFLQATPHALQELSDEAGLIFVVLAGIGGPVALITKATNHTSNLGLAAWVLITAAGLIAYVKKLSEGASVEDAIRGAIEQTKPEFLASLAAVCSATYSAHPATMADNPNATDIPLPDGKHLSELQDKWGIFHQKIQLIKRASPGPERYSAYVGGIDINRNRLDSPGHHGAAWQDPSSLAEPSASPFHDVHSRLTGAAAAEVFHIFRGRYALDLPGESESVVPAPSEWEAAGRDVIQVAQTSYKPREGIDGFPWALHGNATTHGTFVQGIRAAREHIYIEEQYMVPDDVYMQALIDAAGHCQRLIILLPTFLEVYFGDRKRGQFFDQLATAWGERLLIGTPMRRPVLDPPGRTTAKGRFTLLTDIGSTESTLVVGPPARVPPDAFFFWIGGELIYAISSANVTGPDGQPAKALQVLRGGSGTGLRWSSGPWPHKRGEPATASQPTGIFLHSKIMMVDDLFVAIGSTNINRRGFFHDGEVTAFAIPQDLRTAASNPARDLRTRLWAEQLGLAPEMGAALFADPIAGYELFRRTRRAGNRVMPLTELAVPAPTLGTLPTAFEIIPLWARQLLQFTLQNTLEMFSQDIFNTLSDPTTRLDGAP